MRKNPRVWTLLTLLFLTWAAAAAATEPTVGSPLETTLAPDGTLLPEARGSFDARGWNLETGKDGAPRFAADLSADKTACGDGWDDRFTLRGTNAQVTGLAVIGSDVYLCGTFDIAGDAHYRLARWSGTTWSDVGTGVNNAVSDLATDGANLYAAGSFTLAGGVAANRIARWDGTNWSPLGTGFTGATIQALAVWNGDLYAAGSFTAAGGVAASRIARWDGTAWSPLGAGLNGTVYSLVAGADGLYAGGGFTASGATILTNIARWDGASWNALGTGVNSLVTALGVQGGNVYATGNITSAGGIAVNRIARWDGSSWFAMGSGLSANAARAFAVLNGELYVGGSFDYAGGIYSPKLARWNGTTWAAVGNGMTGTGAPSVDALAVMPDGLGGGSLFVGGVFRAAHTTTVQNIARYDGATWHALGDGQAPDNSVWELGAGLDAEGGKVIYAGGAFLQAGSSAAKYIAAWDVDAGAWKNLGTGVNGTVRTIATNGTDLYVGGTFTSAGIYSAINIAHWDGTQWTSVGPNGSGANAQVEIVELCPNGAGGHDLYVGGNFTTIGGIAANRIAKWDGTTWSALGAGCNAWVESIAFADNGAGGYDVYAGGQFTTAGGVPATGIAKWDGSTWSAVGGGLTGPNVGCEEIHVARSGAAGLLMYVGGIFTAAGGQPAQAVAQWDGTTWSALGSGLNSGDVYGMGMRDGLLHVTGSFTAAGGIPAGGLAVWDGANWSQYAGNASVPVANMLLLDGNELYTCGVGSQVSCVTSYNFAHHAPATPTGVDELPPLAGALSQNAPNPFNPQTEIAFRLDRDAHTVLRVFDARGRAVATLVEGALAAGDHSVRFDGRGLASGLYVYRLEIDGVAQARKMMLVR